MIDSKIEPQPGEGRGIKTINQEGPGLQKEEPDGYGVTHTGVP